MKNKFTYTLVAPTVCMTILAIAAVVFVMYSRGEEDFPANTADTVQVCPTCGRVPYPLPPQVEDNQTFELDLFHLRLPKRK